MNFKTHILSISFALGMSSGIKIEAAKSEPAGNQPIKTLTGQTYSVARMKEIQPGGRAMYYIEEGNVRSIFNKEVDKIVQKNPHQDRATYTGFKLIEAGNKIKRIDDKYYIADPNINMLQLVLEYTKTPVALDISKPIVPVGSGDVSQITEIQLQPKKSNFTKTQKALLAIFGITAVAAAVSFILQKKKLLNYPWFSR
jgi:hypothetical protein